MSSDYPQRINKFLARQTGMARREADEAVQSGSVLINGQPAQIGSQVGQGDEVRLRGQIVPHGASRIVIALNKPVNYVSSRRQQGDSPTIYDLLPVELRSLKTVGRLDRDSRGLLLLTNDGDLVHQLTHPSFHKVKQYIVTLNAPLQPLHRQMISDFGVALEDGKSQFELERPNEDGGLSDQMQPSDPEDSAFPAELTQENSRQRVSESERDDGRSWSRTESRPDTTWRITMHEGRNRQIRRTFTALGYTVTDLYRTSLATTNLEALQLPEGEWRDISSSF